MKKSSIKSIVIATTYKCNAKCKMCNIWQNQDKMDLPLESFSNIKNIRYINISGGEPFLRNDLEDLIKILKSNNPEAEFIISSNGYATNLILEKTKKILKIDPKIGIRISIDGLENTHNKIRNVSNIFQNAINTVKELKKLGIENLGIAFTIMNDNTNELINVYELSRKLNVDFSMSSVVSSDIYFQKQDNSINPSQLLKNQINSIIKSQLKTFNPKKWFKAYFNYGILYYLLKGKRILCSDSGINSLFIDIDGNVYISNMSNFCVGNLSNIDLENINLDEILKYKEENQEPWSICTSRMAIRKNFHKIIPWIIINKIKAHLL